ncbi:hypothetical protein DNP83_24465, partial [Salmonella enterica subsp. enterica serovar Panama]
FMVEPHGSHRCTEKASVYVNSGRRAEPMEKRHRRGPAVLPHMLVPCLSTESVGNFVCVRSARRSLTPGA